MTNAMRFDKLCTAYKKRHWNVFTAAGFGVEHEITNNLMRRYKHIARTIAKNLHYLCSKLDEEHKYRIPAKASIELLPISHIASTIEILANAYSDGTDQTRDFIKKSLRDISNRIDNLIDSHELNMQKDDPSRKGLSFVLKVETDSDDTTVEVGIRCYLYYGYEWFVLADFSEDNDFGKTEIFIPIFEIVHAFTDYTKESV